ncbi:MAG: hypothetical protein WCJ45_04135 [bacterium]
MVQYAIEGFKALFAHGFQMYPIFIVIIVGCIIQVTKVIIDIIRYKRIYT